MVRAGSAYANDGPPPPKKTPVVKSLGSSMDMAVFRIRSKPCSRGEGLLPGFHGAYSLSLPLRGQLVGHGTKPQLSGEKQVVALFGHL
jgi:hypothetical protein